LQLVGAEITYEGVERKLGVKNHYTTDAVLKTPENCNTQISLACEDTACDQPTNKTLPTSERPNDKVTKHNVLYNDYLTENDNKDYVI
jgi:hypothetical protein